MWDNNQIFDKRNMLSLSDTKSTLLVGILALFIVFLSFSPHPYHVSYTQVDYKPEAKELTFSIELFTDDLENAIKLEYKPRKFYLGGDTLQDSTEILLQTYIQDKLTVIMDGVVLKKPTFLPSQSTPDRTTIYFEFSDLPKFHSLTLYSELLTSLFQDQQNIIEFNTVSKKEKALLTLKETNVTWIIN
jgi:hypothetical protein